MRCASPRPCPLPSRGGGIDLLARQENTSQRTSMRTLLILAVLVFAPAAQAQTLEELHWLKGCWRTDGGARVVTEVWSAPPMPAMVGYSYTTRDGQIRDWEQMRIEVLDGAPVFIAMPGGGAPVRFRMRAGDGPNRARFENPEHDYPQVVEYRRDGDALTATISRTDGANPIAFNYRRIACEAALAP